MEQLLFPQWLRQLRKHADLTQSELADRVGCAPITLHKLESGQRRPSKQLLERLADCLLLAEPERSTFMRSGRAFDPQAATLSVPTSVSPTPLVAAAVQYPPPIPATRLIDREDTVALIRQRLASQQRILTLLGPAGVGKTRLLLELPRLLQEQFPSAWFVNLVPAQTAHDVLPLIAQTLGVTNASGLPWTTVLCQALRSQSILLLLDNMEHVITAAPWLAELLQQCPTLTLIVTSRIPLRIRGEQHIPIRPLDVPTVDSEHSLEELAHTPAVMLFVERVQAIQPSFALTDQNKDAVVAICQRLDGLPLAIELIAARCVLFSPQALLQQLNQSTGTLRFLNDGPSDLPARHQTLRSALDWGYQLLSPLEQRFFAYLGVLVGQWNLDMAAAICADEAEVLTIVQTLVNHSFIQSSTDELGMMHFQMFTTVREYALEHLQALPEYATVQQRHADYFARLVHECVFEMPELARAQRLQLLHLYYPNVRQCLQWFVEVHALDRLAQLCWSMLDFWYERGLLTDGMTWLNYVLEQHELLDPDLLPQLYYTAAVVAFGQGDYTQALLWLNTARELVQVATPSLYAKVYSMLGRVQAFRGDYAAATEVLQHAEAALDHAPERFREQIAFAQGVLALELGDYSSAKRYLQESIAAMGAHSYGRPMMLLALGRADLYSGDYAAAAAWLDQAEEQSRTLEDLRALAYCWCYQLLLMLLQPGDDDPIDLFQQTLQMFDLNDFWIVLLAAEFIMPLLAKLEPLLAIRICGAVEHLRSQHSRSRATYEQALLDDLKHHLAAEHGERFALIVQEGQHWSIHQLKQVLHAHVLPLLQRHAAKL